MEPSPYRLPAERRPDVPADEGPARTPDEDLLWPFALLWCVAVLRVALALTHSETWRLETALALAVVLGVPGLMRHALRALLRRSRP